MTVEFPDWATDGLKKVVPGAATRWLLQPALPMGWK